MAVYHPAPHSYTGEDMAEIHCHGNPVLVERLLQVIASTHLARCAEKGEFTKRAFLNAKMDLAQAEAVGALISAGSAAGIEMAGALLDGGLSRNVEAICDDLTHILAEIEASFINDDMDVSNESVIEALSPILEQIDSLLKGQDTATSLYSGISTTIAGLPNAGKSSLFNAILGYPRAIVHAEGGTTRDIIRERVTMGGIDFIFHDTAGIRETSSGPERIGVEKTIENLKQSDLVLYVVDARKGLHPDEYKWLGLGRKTITVMNKVDLVDRGEIDGHIENTVWISAKYNSGIDRLTEVMTKIFSMDIPRVFISRHAYLLGKARDCLQQAGRSMESGLTVDVVSIDLIRARQSLYELVGKDADDDILNTIFSQFCVGK